MPAEWTAHESTWLAWPHFRGDWPCKFEPLPWVYAEIIRALTRHERVDLIVGNAEFEKRTRKTLKLANALNTNIRFHRWPTNRVWTRDSGCTFVCGVTSPSREAADSPTPSHNGATADPERARASRKVLAGHEEAPVAPL